MVLKVLPEHYFAMVLKENLPLPNSFLALKVRETPKFSPRAYARGVGVVPCSLAAALHVLPVQLTSRKICGKRAEAQN